MGSYFHKRRGVSQYIHEAYGHKEREELSQIVCRLEEKVSKKTIPFLY